MKPLKEHQINFCRSLKKYRELHYKKTGGIKRLAKRLKISSSQLSNILGGRRCGKEPWRRAIAKEIGVPYDDMIGIDSEKKPSLDLSVYDDVAKLKQIYDSNDRLAEQAIKLNIEIFKNYSELKSEVEYLKKAVEKLLKQDNPEKIGKNEERMAFREFKKEIEPLLQI